MFDLDGLPDLFVHTQFVLRSNSALPALARRLLVVDLSALKFCERPDVAARFAIVLAATVQPIAGLGFTLLSHRARGVAFDPNPEAELKARFDEQRFLHFGIENLKNSALTLQNGVAVVTVLGIPLAARPSDTVPSVIAPLSAQSGAGEIDARSMGGVVLAQNWFALPLS